LTTTLLNLRNKKKKEKEITPTIDADLLEDINKEVSETEEEEEESE
jgi:ribosomal protein S25